MRILVRLTTAISLMLVSITASLATQEEWYAVYKGFVSVEEKVGNGCQKRNAPYVVTVYLHADDKGELEAYLDGSIEAVRLLGGDLEWPQSWVTPERYRIETNASKQHFTLRATQTKPLNDREAEHCFFARFAISATREASKKPDRWQFKEAQDRYLARYDYQSLEADAPEIFDKISTLIDQAIILQAQGQYREAGELWHQVAKIAKEQFGNTHPLHISMIARAGEALAKTSTKESLIAAANLMGYAARQQLEREGGAFSPLVMEYGAQQRRLAREVSQRHASD